MSISSSYVFAPGLDGKLDSGAVYLLYGTSPTCVERWETVSASLTWQNVDSENSVPWHNDSVYVVTPEALYFADGDGTIDAGGAALGFAQAGGRAQNAAGAPQNVVGFNGPDGTGDVLEAQLPDEQGGVRVRGTGFRTGGVVAEQASVGFRRGQLHAEPFFHLLKLFR